MQPDWEIWLNSNLSPAIAKWMQDETGWIVKSSYTLELNGVDDIIIYNRAKAHGKVIIISKDSDFSFLIQAYGTPPKLVLVNKGNCDNRILWAFMKDRIREAVDILVNTDTDIAELD
jgi:predicted nuclease of predicted toxin-antitoxin system